MLVIVFMFDVVSICFYHAICVVRIRWRLDTSGRL